MSIRKIDEMFRKYESENSFSNRSLAFVSFVKETTSKKVEISTATANRFLTRKASEGALKKMLGHFNMSMEDSDYEKNHLAHSNFKIRYIDHGELEGEFVIKIQFKANFTPNKNWTMIWDSNFSYKPGSVEAFLDHVPLSIGFPEDVTNSQMRLIGKKQYNLTMPHSFSVQYDSIFILKGAFNTKMAALESFEKEKKPYYYEFFYTKPNIFGIKSNFKIVTRQLDFTVDKNKQLYYQADCLVRKDENNDVSSTVTFLKENYSSVAEYQSIKLFLI